MLELIDEYCWTKERQILTRERHAVAGLYNISHFSLSASSPPLPVHFHSNTLEIHFMVKGTRYMQIRAEGKVHSYRVTGNQCIITYPMELHGSGNEPQQPCEFYAFQLDVSKPYDLLGLNRETSGALYGQLLSLPSRQMELNSHHAKEIVRIFHLFAEQSPLSSMRATQYLAGFLLGMSELTPIFENQAQQLDEPIRRALEYLNSHITESIRLNDLADAAGYSLSYFKTRFKETVGITPAEYVTMQKIELAKRLLMETNASITELAYHLGYSSSNYFCAVFKKLMNCSPQNYRMRARKNNGE